MKEKDIRWEQRFSNYNRALQKLTEVVESLDLDQDDEDILDSLSELEKEGLIQRFEYVYELAWNVLKDYLLYQGKVDIKGPRDSIKEAFKIGLIKDGDTWMDMVSSRIQTSHTYNEETAKEIFLKVVNKYYDQFIELQVAMERLRSENQGDLFSREI